MGSARCGDAWGCACSNSGRRSGAKLGSAGGEGQRRGMGDSVRAGAGLGGACRTSATCRGPADSSSSTATRTGNGTWRRSTRAHLGRTGTIGTACRGDRSGSSDLGCSSFGPATAPGSRAILGCAWSRRSGRTACPNMGLARARAWCVSAASATVMGCAQAGCSATRPCRAVLGQ